MLHRHLASHHHKICFLQSFLSWQKDTSRGRGAAQSVCPASGHGSSPLTTRILPITLSKYRQICFLPAEPLRSQSPRLLVAAQTSCLQMCHVF